MGSPAVRATDPPGAALAAGVAVVSLIALAGINVLRAFHLLDMASLLRGSPLLGWIETAVVLCSVCGYLFWLYRRHQSLPWVDAVPDEGSGLAIAWHFVPVVNLAKPYLTLVEMWDATAPEGTAATRRRGPVSYFWVTLVGAAALFFAAAFAPNSMGGALDSYLETLARLLLAVSAVFGVTMVLDIDARWRARYAFISQRYDAPSDEALPEFAAISEPSGVPPAAPAATGGVAVVPMTAASRDSNIAPYRPAPPASATAARVPAAVPTTAAGHDVTAAPPRPAPAPVVTGRVPAAVPTTAASHDVTAAPLRTAPPSPAAMNVLAKLRGAGTAAAILALLMAVYIVMLFAMGLSQMTAAISGEAFGNAMARTIVLLFAAIGSFAAIPAIHLWRFSRAAKQFAGEPTERKLHDVLRFQGRYWAFIGGSVAFVVIMEVVLIGLAILIPTVAALIS